MALTMHDALILSALPQASVATTLAEILQRFVNADVDVDESGIAATLRRMVDRGLVSSRKDRVRASDGRIHETRFYAVTMSGETALGEFNRCVRDIQGVQDQSRAVAEAVA